MTTPPVEDYTLTGETTVAELLERFGDAGGFTAKLVARGAGILQEMDEEGDTVFLSFPAAPVATGLRGVLTQLVASGFVDVAVTTCGTLDHDVARSRAAYRHGAFDLDDADLKDEGFHRLGNVLVPEEAYGPTVEAVVRPVLKELADETDGRFDGVTLCRRLGEALPETSLLGTCAARDVPVFVPGLLDGAVGSQVWTYSQGRDVQLDLLADEDRLSDVVHEAGSAGALVVGGGIAKHHTIWWNQFRDGLDRAVYVTTAPEWDGSLSGARMREGVSWNKVHRDAPRVTIPGEATVVLPLLAAAVL